MFFVSLVVYLFQGMISLQTHSIPFLKEAEYISMSHELTYQNLSVSANLQLGDLGHAR